LTQLPPKEEEPTMTSTTHHLTAHWVEEDNGTDRNHHHLTEVWLDEDEAPGSQDLDRAGRVTK
jgi:hypothetical protein